MHDPSWHVQLTCGMGRLKYPFRRHLLYQLTALKLSHTAFKLSHTAVKLGCMGQPKCGKLVE